MKKLLSFLTKGSKIKRILTYLYRGLVVVKAAFESGFDALKKEKPEDKSYDKFTGVSKYLDVAIKAVGIILGWIGVDVDSLYLDARTEASTLNSKKKGASTIDKAIEDLDSLL